MITCEEGLTKIASDDAVSADKNYDLHFPHNCDFHIQVIWSDVVGATKDGRFILTEALDGLNFNNLSGGGVFFDVTTVADSHTMGIESKARSIFRLAFIKNLITSAVFNIYVSVKNK